MNSDLELFVKLKYNYPHWIIPDDIRNNVLREYLSNRENKTNAEREELWQAIALKHICEYHVSKENDNI